MRMQCSTLIFFICLSEATFPFWFFCLGCLHVDIALYLLSACNFHSTVWDANITIIPSSGISQPRKCKKENKHLSQYILGWATYPLSNSKGQSSPLENVHVYKKCIFWACKINYSFGEVSIHGEHELSVPGFGWGENRWVSFLGSSSCRARGREADWDTGEVGSIYTEVSQAREVKAKVVGGQPRGSRLLGTLVGCSRMSHPWDGGWWGGGGSAQGQGGCGQHWVFALGSILMIVFSSKVLWGSLQCCTF